MPYRNRALLVLPDWSYTVRISSMAIQERSYPIGYRVCRLRGDRAIRRWYCESIRIEDPMIVIGAGHGSPSAYSGQHKDIILRVGDAVDPEGRMYYMLSCFTASELGRYMVSKGAVAYIGYTEPFIFATEGGSDPYLDRVGRYFFEPVGIIVSGLLSGRRARSCVADSIASYNIQIDELSRIDEKWAPVVMALVMHDRDCLTLIGNGNASGGRSVVLTSDEIGLIGAVVGGAASYLATKNPYVSSGIAIAVGILSRSISSWV